MWKQRSLLSAGSCEQSEEESAMKEALFYKKLKNKTVQCNLCPNFCTLKDNEYGKCNARKNVKGKLMSMVYGYPLSMHVDPVEKKPLYHFLPGTKTFSICTVGCTLHCLSCQNWRESQSRIEKFVLKKFSPSDIVALANKAECPSISYTYTGPIAFYEYMLDIAKIARKKGLKNIIVSNGYINPEPLKKLIPLIDAANIDLKSMSNKFYKDLCGGRLAPVFETLKTLNKSKVHLEITNLIIPKHNDKPEQIKKLINWVKKNIGTKVPIHFSAFYPCYKMLDTKPTPPATVIKAKKMADDAGLEYVYTGNI